MRHELKCCPDYFKELANRSKMFEVRRNDRFFSVGDILHLREWDPVSNEYTGAHCFRKVSYIMYGGSHGIDKDYCVMSLVLAE